MPKPDSWRLQIYHGIPVISCPWLKKNAAFTPGPFIIKSTDINHEKNFADKDLIHHEIGHVITFYEMGLLFPLYYLLIALPSVISFWWNASETHQKFYTEKIANTLSEIFLGEFSDKKVYPTYNENKVV